MQKILDQFGIAATSLCALHCLALPLLLPILPLIGLSFIASEQFENSLLIITMLLGSYTLLSGYKKYHQRLYPFIPLLLGGILYAIKDINDELEIIFVLLGAISIVTAHGINLYLSRWQQRSSFS